MSGFPRNWRQWPALRDVRLWLLVAALALALAAWAGPGITVPMARADVLVVVDLTGSMNVRDVELSGHPASRLDLAKAAVQRLLTRLPCGSRVGLGIFAERRSFVLSEPVDACTNYAPLAGSIDAFNWRMAWEGDSRIARGLFDALDMARELDVNVLFLTDGHEAPPLPASGRMSYHGTPGETGGVVIGIGGRVPAPIPKFDEDGYEIGVWSESEVDQVNRLDVRHLGSNPRHVQADDEGGAPRTEHLSSVREDYLRELAQETGLGYRHLDRVDTLAPALMEHAHLRREPGRLDLTWPLAALAWLLLAGAYLWPLLARKPLHSLHLHFPRFTSTFTPRNNTSPL